MAFSNRCSTALLLVLVLGLFKGAHILADDPLLSVFEKWMKDYGRTYGSITEKLYRFQVFKDNFQYIESMNNQTGLSYTLGLNNFADLTDKEFLQRYATYRPRNTSNESTPFKYANLASIPSSVDWRTLGAVTPIKNQNPCGSCWAFSAVAAIEGINEISTGNLISLSEQELIDCVTDCNGCNGGWPDYAFYWVAQNGGITTEDDYPYTSGTTNTSGTCDSSKTSNYAATILGYQYVTPYNESDLAKAVANQPVSIILDASRFKFYTGGIFSGPCGTEQNHAVTAVGYGILSNGTKYWIVKNSWGTSWGESGYIRMEKDISSTEGLCGLATQPCYPI